MVQPTLTDGKRIMERKMEVGMERKHAEKMEAETEKETWNGEKNIDDNQRRMTRRKALHDRMTL